MSKITELENTDNTTRLGTNHVWMKSHKEFLTCSSGKIVTDLLFEDSTKNKKKNAKNIAFRIIPIV